MTTKSATIYSFGIKSILILTMFRGDISIFIYFFIKFLPKAEEINFKNFFTRNLDALFILLLHVDMTNKNHYLHYIIKRRRCISDVTIVMFESLTYYTTIIVLHFITITNTSWFIMNISAYVHMSEYLRNLVNISEW